VCFGVGLFFFLFYFFVSLFHLLIEEEEEPLFPVVKTNGEKRSRVVYFPPENPKMERRKKKRINSPCMYKSPASVCVCVYKMTEEFISIQGNGEYIITDTTHRDGHCAGV
jgi:hypothetical protein